MTYCVALKLDRGLVFAADTRTNAGLDNVAVFKKLHVWEKADDRVITLLSAGNLAVTQAVVSLLSEHMSGTGENKTTLMNAETMFQVARLVGSAVRQVKDIDGEALAANADNFFVTFIMGGQIKGEEPRLFQIYAAGNFIEVSDDTPFLQIGEHKYGKPILDRVTRADMRLGEAAKMVLLSFDSTLRSNLSVGMPIDLMLYTKDSFSTDRHMRIEQNDAYFRKLSDGWSQKLREAFSDLDELDV
ncbi:putative proteasome-type protease [Roseibium hamelinense]|uniref:Putative proteasome-type protease n=1 Tax=Roseibium hamelinense TaxID=150831 RepID=A0A562SGY6_9HYPH|nr:proteasome-type protease [Roseibium hamelinense]MTI44152.1 peptidase [Roseibium hamelinense]TWI80066.1 putative proteasome-type protease [Roseibium hamelinense]